MKYDVIQNLLDRSTVVITHYESTIMDELIENAILAEDWERLAELVLQGEAQIEIDDFFHGFMPEGSLAVWIYP